MASSIRGRPEALVVRERADRAVRCTDSEKLPALQVSGPAYIIPTFPDLLVSADLDTEVAFDGRPEIVQFTIEVPLEEALDPRKSAVNRKPIR